MALTGPFSRHQNGAYMARPRNLRLVETPGAQPVVVEDPSEPCATCHLAPYGADTPVLRAWKSIIPKQAGPATWWISPAGAWTCKTCHPPGDPKSVVREIIIGDVAKEK